MGRELTEREKELVSAVRSDKQVGHGSCSSVDECLTDEELVERFVTEETTKESLLREVYEYEDIWVERCIDVNRSGGENEALCSEMEEARRGLKEAISDLDQES